MDSVTVSTKYQVVIPQRVRQSLNIQPGQKMQVKEARGSLKGIDTDLQREKEDRAL